MKFQTTFIGKILLLVLLLTDQIVNIDKIIYRRLYFFIQCNTNYNTIELREFALETDYRTIIRTLVIGACKKGDCLREGLSL